MKPNEALSIVHQALRAVNTSHDNHDIFDEAVQTLAKVVQELSRDGAKEETVVE